MRHSHTIQTRAAMLRVWGFVRHVARAGKALATDRTLPRWLRVVLVVACLPIPGPVDNLVQIGAVVIVAIWYRPALINAWVSARTATTEA